MFKRIREIAECLQEIRKELVKIRKLTGMHLVYEVDVNNSNRDSNPQALRDYIVKISKEDPDARKDA